MLTAGTDRKTLTIGNYITVLTAGTDRRSLTIGISVDSRDRLKWMIA